MLREILSLYTTIFSTKVFNIFLTILSSLDLRYSLKFKDDFFVYLKNSSLSNKRITVETKSIQNKKIFTIKKNKIKKSSV